MSNSISDTWSLFMFIDVKDCRSSRVSFDNPINFIFLENAIECIKRHIIKKKI